MAGLPGAPGPPARHRNFNHSHSLYQMCILYIWVLYGSTAIGEAGGSRGARGVPGGRARAKRARRGDSSIAWRHKAR